MSSGLWTRPLPGPGLPTSPAPAGVVVTPVGPDDLDALGAAYWAASPPGTMDGLGFAPAVPVLV